MDTERGTTAVYRGHQARIVRDRRNYPDRQWRMDTLTLRVNKTAHRATKELALDAFYFYVDEALLPRKGG